MNILEKSVSQLKEYYIITEDIKFHRQEEIPANLVLNNRLCKHVVDLGNNQYKVSLTLDIFSDNKELDISVTMAGKFELIGDFPDAIRKDLINKNTISIIFPYLRSQITLITAQPDLKPIVLPPININSLLEQIESREPQE